MYVEDIQSAILSTRGVSKSFPGVQALDSVNIDILRGKVNAIVGENGAGKSTLMKILSGVYPDYEGRIYLEGEEVRFQNPREAEKQGIAIIHQELNLVPNLSVAENIYLGREYRNLFGFIDYSRMYKESTAILEQLDLDVPPETLVSKLRVGQQQVVEIAKALSLNAKIIIMDEPTSAISKQEVRLLFDLIESLQEDGVTIIYISHKLDELFEIADRVIILRDGKFIHSDSIENLNHEEIVQSMVGRDVESFFVKEEADRAGEVLRVTGLRLEHPVRSDIYQVNDVDFSLSKGEVLGIFGLMGAGRTELLETIFGVHTGRASGEIQVEGETVSIGSPSEAIQAGIALVPEDRQLEGLVLNRSVAENVSLANIGVIERQGILNAQAEREMVEEHVRQLNIKTPNIHQQAEYLSGGNQQKVVIAKWLATNPKILMLDEPTRGIDVNGKNEIYKLISELANAGLGIIMVSSELPEILAIADRILVLSEGRKTGEFSQQEANEELLMKAAIPRSI